MSSRLVNSNSVSRPKSPIIVVLRDINDSKDKPFVLKKELAENISNHLDNASGTPEQEQITFLDSRDDENESGLVWSRNRSTEFDNNATEYFLQIRGSEKYRALFASKKFGRNKLWGQIAQEMNNAGYYVGEGREAAERCRQKFSNLEKAIINYMKHISVPGSKKRDPPQFYDLLVDLVDYESKLYKNQNSVDNTRESLEVGMLASTDADACLSSQGSAEKDASNDEPDDDNLYRTSKHKNEVIALLTKQHAEIVKLQREYLDKLDKHLAIQNEQRERMINSFVQAMKESSCSCSKRKRRASSMESD